MSQQSNAATLREALSECVADWRSKPHRVAVPREMQLRGNLADLVEVVRLAVNKCADELDAALAASGTEAAPSEFTHGRNCPANVPLHEEDCTCGLKWRIQLQTEQEMHNAWRKRAEEAEATLAQSAAPSGGAALWNAAKERERLALQIAEDLMAQNMLNVLCVNAFHVINATLFAQESKMGTVTGAGERPVTPNSASRIGSTERGPGIPESGETPPRNRRKQNIPYLCGHDDCPCTGGFLHAADRELDQKLAGETGAVKETK